MLELIAGGVRYRRVGCHELNMESSRRWAGEAIALANGPVEVCNTLMMGTALVELRCGCLGCVCDSVGACTVLLLARYVCSHAIFTVYVDCTPTRPDDHEYGVTRYGKASTPSPALC